MVVLSDILPTLSWVVATSPAFKGTVGVVGTLVGVFDGRNVGVLVGIFVGVKDGMPVGVLVGSCVSLAPKGALVGFKVGNVGFNVGDIDGTVDGF